MRKGKRHPACFLSLRSEDLLAGPGGHLGPRPTQTLSNCSSVRRLGRQWLCCEEGARSGFLLNTMASQIPNSLYLVMICGVNIQVIQFLGPSDDRNMEDLDCVLSRGTVNLSSWLHLYTGI